VVGRHPDRLPHRGHPRGAVAGRAGMGQRRVGVVVDEGARSYQVSGDALGVTGVESPKCFADGAVEVAGVGPIRQFRPGRERRTTVLPVGTGPVGSGPTRGTPVVGGPTVPPVPRATVIGTAWSVPLRPLGVRSPALGPATVRTVALRAAVLPLRPLPLRAAVLPLRPLPLRTIALWATVLPLRTIPLRAIALWATSLRTIALRTLTLRTAVLLRPLPLRTAVLPLRPLPLRTAVLRVAALRTLTLWAGVLPLGTTTLRAAVLRRRAAGAPAGYALGAIAGRMCTLRTTVLPTSTLGPSTRLRTLTLRTTVLPTTTLRPSTRLRTLTLRTTVLPLRAIPSRPRRSTARAGPAGTGCLSGTPSALPGRLVVARRSVLMAVPAGTGPAAVLGGVAARGAAPG
jgi:hypothetical protein